MGWNRKITGVKILGVYIRFTDVQVKSFILRNMLAKPRWS